jgi:hypothetical protein
MFPRFQQVAHFINAKELILLHCQYLKHLQEHLSRFASDGEFWKSLNFHSKELTILVDINLDPVIGLLDNLYCPTVRREHRDPVELLRSLMLMTLIKEPSITEWVSKTNGTSIYAIMAGFDPADVPGVGTYYDFMKRMIDGPYHRLATDEVRRSVFNAGKHIRNLKEEKDVGKDELNPNQTLSAKVAKQLMAHSDQPRPNDFIKILDDLLMRAGIEPTIESGLLGNLQGLAVSGDGSIMQTAASGNGKPTCTCRSQGVYRCDHNRQYTTPTAQWCYDHHHDRYVFGDRYYLMVVHQNSHDLPLMISMPGGNESDYTLSLKTLDRMGKCIVENHKDMRITIFIGDGHHDSYAHYDYLKHKGIVPIIPLCANSEKLYPHALEDEGIRSDTDGTPLCPAGVRMRHHLYNKDRQTHVYCCPVKRNTHREGKSVYVTRLEECPRKQDCAPESSLGPIVNVKSEKDPRLFPPIPRSTQRFKDLMKMRSATERGNSVIDSYGIEGSSRNPDYGLIRLNLVGIVHHAVVRNMEAAKKSSQHDLFLQTLEKIGVKVPEQYRKAG